MNESLDNGSQPWAPFYASPYGDLAVNLLPLLSKSKSRWSVVRGGVCGGRDLIPKDRSPGISFLTLVLAFGVILQYTVI